RPPTADVRRSHDPQAVEEKDHPDADEHQPPEHPSPHPPPTFDLHFHRIPPGPLRAHARSYGEGARTAPDIRRMPAGNRRTAPGPGRTAPAAAEFGWIR